MLARSGPSARSKPRFDYSPALRTLMLAAGGGLALACLVALLRALAGIAPAHPGLKEIAVVVHLAGVLPAVPLGLYVLLMRKGTALHKALGRLWIALMLTGAVSALFIRHINDGGFSWIHLFVPLTLVASWRAVAAARRGDIATHRRQLAGLFLGALVVPGLFAFLPDRLMGSWLLG